MKIIVCIKQVPDTNAVQIDPVTGILKREGVPSIINPDDMAGLEAALRLKEQFDATVTVISMGPPQADTALREALAMGADQATLITDRAFGGSDTFATSSILASAIRDMEYDIIITGRQAIDGDTAQVGPQISEHLGIVGISYAEEITIEGEYVIVKQQHDGCSRVLKAKMPCLITALSELNQPRYMTPGGIFDAYRIHQVRSIGRNDLNVEEGNIGLDGSPTKVIKSFTKPVKGQGTVVSLESQEAAAWIAEKLHEKSML